MHGGENKSDRNGSYTCDEDVANGAQPAISRLDRTELDRISASVEAHRFGMPKGLLETDGPAWNACCA
jgi:hypothetical protein